MRLWHIIFLVFSSAFFPLRAFAAEDCPNALAGSGSYTLEQGVNRITEVFYDDGPTVKTEFRIGGQLLLATTLYQGLFELHRLDRGLLIESKPRDDLGKFFPLRPLQNMPKILVTSFDLTSSEAVTKNNIRVVRLRYIGAQEFKIGDCTYPVLKFQRDENWPSVSNIDYYAPQLKLVIAKEYSDHSIRSYERIHSAAH